jgi:hypothetical protein
MLGAKALWSLEKRRTFIHEALQIKYEKILSLPLLEPEEFVGQGFEGELFLISLQTQVQLRVLHERLAWSGGAYTEKERKKKENVELAEVLKAVNVKSKRFDQRQEEGGIKATGRIGLQRRKED